MLLSWVFPSPLIFLSERKNKQTTQSQFVEEILDNDMRMICFEVILDLNISIIRL